MKKKKRKNKKTNPKFARFRKEGKKRGESTVVSEQNGRNAVNPGSSFYDRAYSWIRGDIVY